MKYKLEPHQAKAVEEMHNGCILVGDVGSGKSFTTVKYYEKYEAPRDIYVITTARKRNDGDWENEFDQINVGPARDATLSGVLTVDSWNNIGKYEDVKDAFFVFDEQRVVGSGSWTKSFYKIARANRWVLLSATPGDTWLDYIPVFVANGFYKNKTAFINEHVQWTPRVPYPKVQRYLNPGRLVRHRNSLLVKMPMMRHTVRRLSWKETAYDEAAMDLVQKKRWNVFESKPLKDVAELFRVARKLVNSDDSRIGEVRTLMSRHPRLIVFYNFDYELEMLRTLAEDSTGTLPSTQPSSPDSSSSTISSSSTTSTTPEPASLEKTSTDSSGSRSKTGSGLGSKPGGVDGAFPDSETSEENDLILQSKLTETGRNPRSLTSGSDGIRHTSVMDGATTSTPCETKTETGGSLGSQEDLERSKDLHRNPSCADTTSKSSRSSTSGPTSSEGESEWATSSTQTVRLSTGSSHSGRKSFGETVTALTTAAGGGQTPSPSLQGKTATAADVSLGSTQTPTDSTHSAPLVVAEWNGHKHEPVPTSERWLYLVQYTAGSEGWNCTTTDAMAFWSLTYSYKVWYQAFGRIDRMNTRFTELHYYALASKSWIDLMIRKSLSQKKDFNESSSGIKI